MRALVTVCRCVGTIVGHILLQLVVLLPAVWAAGRWGWQPADTSTMVLSVVGYAFAFALAQRWRAARRRIPRP